MLFKFSSVVALTIASLAVASPEPQTPAQSTAAAEAIVSYIEAQATDPALMSLLSKYATDTSAIAQITSVIGSLEAQVKAGQTPASDFFTALPSDASSYFGSVFTAEQSILAANGFGAQATGGSGSGTGTSSSKGGAVPTQAVGVAAAGFAGFMGIVLAL